MLITYFVFKFAFLVGRHMQNCMNCVSAKINSGSTWSSMVWQVWRGLLSWLLLDAAQRKLLPRLILKWPSTVGLTSTLHVSILKKPWFIHSLSVFWQHGAFVVWYRTGGVLAFSCSPPHPQWLYGRPSLLANWYWVSRSNGGQNKNPATYTVCALPLSLPHILV